MLLCLAGRLVFLDATEQVEITLSKHQLHALTADEPGVDCGVKPHDKLTVLLDRKHAEHTIFQQEVRTSTAGYCEKQSTPQLTQRHKLQSSLLIRESF
ncbi:MAG: hypothetical protein MHM6MM_007442 [Cercozoa sp. M6MM]